MASIIQYAGSDNKSLHWCVTDIIGKGVAASPPSTPPISENGNNGNDSGGGNKSCGCTISSHSSYPELKFLNPCPASHPTLFKTVATKLKNKLPSNESLARAIFGIIWSESTRDGTDAETGKFVDAGGYNFSGIQTDSGRWGGGASNYITGRYTKRDAKRCREFASFNSLDTYLDFMINRASAKGFNGFDNNKWTKTYICNWWNPSSCSQATPGNPVFELKKSWYKAAMKRWNKLNIY